MLKIINNGHNRQSECLSTLENIELNAQHPLLVFINVTFSSNPRSIRWWHVDLA